MRENLSSENFNVKKYRVKKYKEYKIKGESRYWAKARLMIIDCPDGGNYLNLDGRWANPVIVSDTEKYEIGDDVIWDGKLYTNIQGRIKGIGVKKVLALPIMFSSKHRKKIIDGEWVDGQDLLIEVKGYLGTYAPPDDHEIDEYIEDGLLFNAVYLDKNDLINLHNVIERTYSLDDVKKMACDFARYSQQADALASNRDKDIQERRFDEWIENNDF